MLASQKTKITELFKNALAAVGAPENTKIVLERPKQQSHGDIARSEEHTSELQSPWN